MKALTLHRPWSTAVALYGKTIENRPWAPRTWMIGRSLAIHAGQVRDPAGIEKLQAMGCDPFPDFNEIEGYWNGRCFNGNGVVALCEFAGFISPNERLSCGSRPSAEQIDLWCTGPWGWVFDHVVKVGPYPCGGRQGLWNLPPDIERLALEDAARNDPWWAEREEGEAA